MFRFLKIHTVPPEEEGSTWLQLFFDLVYVAILVELGNRLSHDLTLEGIATFVLLLLPIWWSWNEFVDYGRHYPIDDIGQRILTVLYMASMLLLAFEIHSLDRTGLRTFVITYGLSKFVLALMYSRAWIYYPTYRHLTRNKGVAFFMVGFMWFGVALFTPTYLWVLALLIILGVLAPILLHLFYRLATRSPLPEPPIKYHFMLHRFGELTIIVLGEFFIKLVVSSAGRELTAVNYLIGAGLLAISVCLWWLYFDHLEHTRLADAGSRLWVWTYSHYPFLLGITAYGVIGNLIFSARPRAPLDDTWRLLFTAALATALLAYALIEWATREKDEPLARTHQPWIRIGGAGALLALGLVGGSLNVGWLVGLVSAIFLLQVGLDVATRLRRPEPDAAVNSA